MKKIGFLLLALLLVFGALLTACSDEKEGETKSSLLDNTVETAYRNENTGDTFLYATYTSDSVEIIGYTGSDMPHSVTVPSEIDGKSVERIGDEAFKNQNSITAVILPDTVTEIGAFAFAGCDYLASVQFSSTLVSIGECAFYDCAVTAIALPATVEELGERAFYQCTELVSVSFAGNTLKEIRSAAFYECTALTAIEIPNGVEKIGSFAFYGCTELATVTLPDSLTEIGEYVFTKTIADTNGDIPFPKD